MQTPTGSGPRVVKLSPLYSVRFDAGDNFNGQIIPREDTRRKSDNAVTLTTYGDRATAVAHYENIVATGKTPSGKDVKSAELHYGGDLVNDNKVVVGGQVLRRWTPEKGDQVLLVDPVVPVKPSVSEEETEAIDATIDPSAAVPGPEESADQSHIPGPGQPLVNHPVDGTPQLEKIPIPVGEGTQKLAGGESEPS